MKEIFEMWFIAQFGENKRGLLRPGSDGGYQDEVINGMWIGFNIGFNARDQLLKSFGKV
jgi:hypothetical protein